MKKSFVRKSANAFFKNKRANVLNNIADKNGKILIKKGYPVIIIGKCKTNKESLDIKLGLNVVLGVNPEDLELEKTQDLDWPIESDTLDIREQNFY